MQILKNIGSIVPSTSYTLNLSSEEMLTLRRALDFVDVPDMEVEHRVPFWQLYTDITLGMN